MGMKAFISLFAVLLTAAIFIGCHSAAEIPEKTDQENTTGRKSTMRVFVDEPSYDSADEIFESADNIFSGTVKEINFEIFNMKTGEIDRNPESNDTDRMLYTVYVIDVQNTYKGEEKGERSIRVTGGLTSRIDEQFELLESAGLSDTYPIIPVTSSKIKLSKGVSYLFCTDDSKSGVCDIILNSDQFAQSISSAFAQEIIDYCELQKANVQQ